MNNVKNIVNTGLYQGWAKDNIISQIMIEIASKEELELLEVWCDMPELEAKAEALYNTYREEYYKD